MVRLPVELTASQTISAEISVAVKVRLPRLKLRNQ